MLELIPTWLCCLASFLFCLPLWAHGLDVQHDPTIKAHMRYLIEHDGFNPQELMHWYAQARIQPEILQKIQHPYEQQPWYRYKQWFLKPNRVQAGLAFWHQHHLALERAERCYGVPPEIIVAILGIETFYGRYQAPYRALDALVTLAYGYPKRGAFFRSELEALLLLAQEQHLPPTAIPSSYAGAIGLPQFMPSSYRSYAVDFDHDHHIDLIHSPTDAIGSVANYLHHFGWNSKDPIVLKLKKAHLPKQALGDFTLETQYGHDDWHGFPNFFVITRYNPSRLYAMAVYQLSQQLKKNYESTVRSL